MTYPERIVTWIAASVALAALLAGCADDADGPDDPDGALDPTGEVVPAGDGPTGDGRPGTGSRTGSCELLSATEVGDAIGRPVDPGDGDGTSCRWVTTDDPAYPVPIQVHLDLRDYGLGEEEGLVERASEQLSEVGDDAYWDHDLMLLLVRVDDTYVTVQVIDVTGVVDQRSAAVVLGELLIGRIGGGGGA